MESGVVSWELGVGSWESESRKVGKSESPKEIQSTSWNELMLR